MQRMKLVYFILWMALALMILAIEKTQKADVFLVS